MRSPCAELSDTPSTVMGSVPMAPAHSQKAALDQSPSMATLPGVRYEPLLTRKFVTSGWPSLAGMRSTLTSTPKAFMAWIVRLM